MWWSIEIYKHFRVLYETHHLPNQHNILWGATSILFSLSTDWQSTMRTEHVTAQNWKYGSHLDPHSPTIIKESDLHAAFGVCVRGSRAQGPPFFSFLRAFVDTGDDATARCTRIPVTDQTEGFHYYFIVARRITKRFHFYSNQSCASRQLYSDASPPGSALLYNTNNLLVSISKVCTR